MVKKSEIFNDFVHNLGFISDFYELTMANGYLENGFENTIAVFDVFFRKVPDNGGFAIFAGLEQVIEFLTQLNFSEFELNFLREMNLFSAKFLEFLKNFKFSCDLWSVEEGTPIFPNEPFLVVRGPIVQAQMLETVILNLVNHQSLIATKANRIVRAANGKNVLEFGARRAHGFSGALYGSRAAFIGGCFATSYVEAGFKFKIPVVGTMSHSWVQSFDSEIEAFSAFVKSYPKSCVLLVDTYSVLKSGVLNAIKIFKNMSLNSGVKKAIRIDSGDISYFSKKARKMLDDEGCFDVSIIASNALDEFLIEALNRQGACVDEFAVGENLITSKTSPVFGGVYKLCGIEKNGVLIPKIKISESIDKINLPGMKRLYRFFDSETNNCVADLITLCDENFDKVSEFNICDPQAKWKKKTLKNVFVKQLLVPIFRAGKLVYRCPDIKKIRNRCLNEVKNSLWSEVKRFDNPHKYYVDWSDKLFNLRTRLLEKF